jgi:hypothetical protein
MAWIPPDARWYLAEIVEEFTVEDDSDNVVHTNMVLIEADSPEDAYSRAIEIGRQSETAYTNTDGKRVSAAFRGLRDLNVIHGELAHGTELIYSRHDGMTRQELDKWVSPKEKLGVFRPIEPPGGRE